MAMLVAAACVLVSVSFHLYDADAWQHLVFGRAIWTLGMVPHTQVFTWPNYGAPLVNPSWGFDALVWLWRYFLLGAVIVVPIWLIVRLMRAAKER